jgi:two-component system chemotaxis response regulator CheY
MALRLRGPFAIDRRRKRRVYDLTFLVSFARQEVSIALDITMPVLVVDDQETMVDLTRRILGRLGFTHVDQTCDGYQALAMLRQSTYRLVISDLHMEIMGGIQVLRAIRADEQLKRTRFLVMTGSLGVPDVVAAKHAGTDAYLLKPFTSEQLDVWRTPALALLACASWGFGRAARYVLADE